MKLPGRVGARPDSNQPVHGMWVGVNAEYNAEVVPLLLNSINSDAYMVSGKLTSFAAVRFIDILTAASHEVGNRADVVRRSVGLHP
jgi:hypothetical protein